MNRSWFIYYGLSLGMDRKATLETPYGEFMDLLSCDSISKGQARQKKPKKKMTFEEFVALK